MNIVNVINFVRAVEPRSQDDSYLFATTADELELCARFGFDSTLLLQYDALIRDDYVGLIRDFREKHSGLKLDVGLWLEVVQPLCEDAGLPWRGLYPWDWHSDVGFTVGYEPDERLRLIDAAMEGFRRVFGEYPSAVGSWHIDAVSLKYLEDKYKTAVSCTCKEQFGTDGYTLWGGVYSGAYYPSVNNMLCPASGKDLQIDLPVFRMLGADPVRQYDLGVSEGSRCQGVRSMEPVYGNSGADPDWVDAYFANNFNGRGLNLSYVQLGQENSFGGDSILPGLTMQFEKLRRLSDAGTVEVLTLTESGRRFRRSFPQTPPMAQCFEEKTPDGDFSSVWYQSRDYRINFYSENGVPRIRDLYLFDDGFREKYLDRRETSHNCAYFNLPVVDGYRFSDLNVRAGLYPKGVTGGVSAESVGTDSLRVKLGGGMTVTAGPQSVRITSDADFTLGFVYAPGSGVPYVGTDGERLYMKVEPWEGYSYGYSVRLEKGCFRKTGNGGYEIRSEDSEVVICVK
ncbi:MAG: hypothetical protein K6C36_04930 [Clostridia bacterium]|nr:hypothetical protein [Clostridia bacterium]